MADQAKVTSIDVLESFRASLIVFLNKAHASADEVGDEIRRTRMWVQNERWLFWEAEIRKRSRRLDQAEQELLSAKLSGLRDNISAQEMAVRKARKAVEEGEDKLRKVKHWAKNFEQHFEPLIKKLGGLREVLDHDLPKGVSYLLQAQRTLEGYTQLLPDQAPAAPTTPQKEES